jgi:hypothetical protein
MIYPRGDAPRFARACPWLLYFAPLALYFDFLCKAAQRATSLEALDE